MATTMKAPVQIETARLTLRQPGLDDASAIFERYASDPEVTRLLGWPRHRMVEDTEAFLRFSAEEWKRWPVVHGEVIGLRKDRSETSATTLLTEELLGSGASTASGHFVSEQLVEHPSTEPAESHCAAAL